MAALAVEQHRVRLGTLPRCISECEDSFVEWEPIDPFDGKRIRYAMSDPGYRLWSVGPDLTDDSGTSPEYGKPKPGEDITFVVQR